jgi:hypothetical protein
MGFCWTCVFVKGALLKLQRRYRSAGSIRRYERIFPRYTALGVEEGAFCREANERVGVDRYGPKYILASAIASAGYLQGHCWVFQFRPADVADLGLDFPHLDRFSVGLHQRPWLPRGRRNFRIVTSQFSLLSTPARLRRKGELASRCAKYQCLRHLAIRNFFRLGELSHWRGSDLR